MTAKPRFKSDAMEAIFESAQAMHAAGAITDDELRGYERDCFAPPRASKVQFAAKPPANQVLRKSLSGENTSSKTGQPRRAIRKALRSA